MMYTYTAQGIIVNMHFPLPEIYVEGIEVQYRVTPFCSLPGITILLTIKGFKIWSEGKKDFKVFG